MIKLYLALLRSSEVIPETGTKSKNIPGWNDYIKHLKLTASFWRNLWRDISSPLTGHIHDIMKETRRKYHYGIRNVKSNEEDIKKQKIAETLCDNNSRQFWLEVKKIRNKKPCLHNVLIISQVTKTSPICFYISITNCIILFIMMILKCPHCVMRMLMMCTELLTQVNINILIVLL